MSTTIKKGPEVLKRIAEELASERTASESQVRSSELVACMTCGHAAYPITDEYELYGLKELLTITPDDPIAKPLLESRIRELEKKVQANARALARPDQPKD